MAILQVEEALPEATERKVLSVREVINGLRKEIDAYYQIMNSFSHMDSSDIFRNLSAMSARISQVRGQLLRHEQRAFQAFRNDEIDPFLKEVDRQFRTWSRAFSVHTLDWEMTRGT